MVISDEFSGYTILDKKHKNNFVHLTVNHSAGQFAVGDIHTNKIESFWICFKRGGMGRISISALNISRDTLMSTVSGQTIGKIGLFLRHY